MTTRLVVLLVVTAVVAAAILVRSRQRSVVADVARIDASLLPCGTVGAAVWVLFSTPYCVPCRRVASVFTDADAELVRVDVTDEPALSDALDVRRSPTLVRIAADGAVLERHEGVAAEAAARRAVGHDVADAAIA